MLQSLHIQNYALIDKLDIEFKYGFSVITGETGAGKSILLGAIGLLLGQRADSKTIKSGAQRCVVEAEFDIKDLDVEDFFVNQELEYDPDTCIIRRELTAAGKSRAFVNDTPVALTVLKDLGEQLIDIHSQHQNLFLNKNDFQLHVLDALAQNQATLNAYKDLYAQYTQAISGYEAEKELLDREMQEQEYLDFQHQQLQDARLQEDEEEELEQELQTLEHAEEIKETLSTSLDILDNETQGVIGNVRQLQRKIESIATVFPAVEEISERLDSCYIELRDMASEMSHHAEEIEFDPRRLDSINERLSLLHSLKQKFRVSSVIELMEIQKQLAERLSHIENSEDRLNELQKRIAETEAGLNKYAEKLTAERKKAAEALRNGICEKLVLLGMPHARFEVQAEQESNFTPHGKDHVTFVFSSNKNVPPQPISQVASGGEISRVMLALKVMLNNIADLPTIIFDEIDTGVSGSIAESMGQMMKEMGEKKNRQVISITHLPQIAALGSQHYRVYKSEDTGNTVSQIVALDKEERIQELARMLSGSTLTQAAIDNARSLLGF